MNVKVILDARVVADPERVSLKSGKALTKVRLADNPPGKPDKSRPAKFVTGKAFGAQADAIARLSKGDVITVVGNEVLEAYTAKDGTEKTAEVLNIQSFRVQKSETFFGEKTEKTEEPGSDDDMPF